MDIEARGYIKDTHLLEVMLPQGSVAALSRHIEYSERDATVRVHLKQHMNGPGAPTLHGKILRR